MSYKILAIGQCEGNSSVLHAVVHNGLAPPITLTMGLSAMDSQDSFRRAARAQQARDSSCAPGRLASREGEGSRRMADLPCQNGILSSPLRS